MRFRLGRRTWLVTLLAIALISLTALRAAAKYPGTNGQIAFTHYDDTGSHVFIANPDGGNPKQLPADDADLAVWSPGGSQILLTICCPSGPPRTRGLRPGPRAGRAVPETAAGATCPGDVTAKRPC